MSKELISRGKNDSYTGAATHHSGSHNNEEPVVNPVSFLPSPSKTDSNIIQKKQEPSLPFIKTASYGEKKPENEGNIPDDVRLKMEKSFAADFSAVKVFQNSQPAKDLDAIAYTQGNEIHFAPGHNPFSPQGQEFLGHELSHVIQQRNNEVKTTNQEAGFNINSDKNLESQADEAGKKAAAGQQTNLHANTNSNPGSLVQKKSNPIQLLRLLPAGAPIQELDISNPDGVKATFSNLWKQFNGFGWLNNSFNSHAELPEVVSGVLSGNYFRGSREFVSEWYDEGVNDWWNAGILDNDVRIIMSLYLDNEQTRHEGSGQFSSGGTTTDTKAATHTETATLAGEASTAQGPLGNTYGGKAGGSYAVSDSTTRSMAVSGTSGLSMEMPAKIRKADIKFKCTLKVNPTGLAIRSKEAFTDTVGTIVFGSPA